MLYTNRGGKHHKSSLQIQVSVIEMKRPLDINAISEKLGEAIKCLSAFLKLLHMYCRRPQV